MDTRFGNIDAPMRFGKKPAPAPAPTAHRRPAPGKPLGMASPLSFLFVFSLAACANLDEVRDYAAASRKLADYRDLTLRFRDTYQREQPYLTKAADAAAKDNDRRRTHAYHELLQIQKIVGLYMRTLARLAGEQADQLGSAGGSLTEAIAALPEFGLTARHADAYGKLLAQISRVATSDYQQQHLKSLIRNSDDDLQTLLEAMSALTELYNKTNANERKTVLGMLETELAFADNPKNRLLTALARSQMQTKTREYQAVQRRYGALEKGLMAMALGHKALLDNIDQLDHESTRAAVQEFTAQIRTSNTLLAANDLDEIAGAP